MYSPVYPRKPRPRRNHRRVGSTPATPPVTEVLVVSVTTLDGGTANVEFNLPVTVTGPGPVGFYVDMDGIGEEYAIDSTQVSPNVVRYWYQDSGVAPGRPWRIEGVLENLDLHGKTMPVPQSGVVE